MPTLSWIGKDKIINHHNEIPFHSLVKSETFNNDNSENMIIHGDNLYALKALLPKYEGRINCIYIDPPYNTGNEGWAYNDNVNDPRIKKWLGQVVGAQGEDLSRHDKWLCMMYPRLRLAWKLLSKDGVIFISHDDNEQANLRLICNEIFGENNFLVNMIVVSAPAGTQSSVDFAQQHSYCLAYRKSDEFTSNYIKLTKKELKEKYSYGSDSLGDYYIERLWKRGIGGRMEDVPSLHFPVWYNEQTNEILIDDEATELEQQTCIKIIPYQTAGVLGRWTWSREKMKRERDHLIVAKVAGEWKLHKKVYSSEDKGKKPFSIVDSSIGRTELGSLEIKKIMDEKVFEYPKYSGFVKYLISLHKNKNAIVLDFFAGSGTTAQAVLELNKEDGGHRQFILCEMMDYAKTITAERMKRVINGYADVEGTGGDFGYYELGERIFDDYGNINKEIDIDSLRKYIYYTETKSEPVSNDKNKYFLGSYNKTSYYFCYEKERMTTLDSEFVSKLVKKDEAYIVYADVCYLSEYELRKYGIIFKKIPRDIERI